MGAGSAAGSGNSNETSTPFGTSKGTATKTRFGYTKPPKTARETVVDFVTEGGFTGAAIKGVKKVFEAGNKVNQDFYENKVKPAGKTNLGYKDYLAARGAGTIDAYGNKIQQGDGGNNTPTVIKKNIGGNTIQTTAPTEAEVSQSEAANADAAALKVKKKGRSSSIMTSSQGVTKVASNYSLGKKSLLGQV
jgi:hypothetical protein